MDMYIIVLAYLTLGADVQVCKYVRPSVRLLPCFLPIHATRWPKSDTNGFSATLA